MRCTGKPPAVPTSFTRVQTSVALSYEYLAGAMAAKITSLLRSSHSRGLFPPFQIVIMSQHGTVVFEFEVNKKGKVLHGDATHQVLRSHLPATVFFTDRAHITRTFSLEQSNCGGA